MRRGLGGDRHATEILPSFPTSWIPTVTLKHETALGKSQAARKYDRFELQGRSKGLQMEYYFGHSNVNTSGQPFTSPFERDSQGFLARDSEVLSSIIVAMGSASM